MQLTVTLVNNNYEVGVYDITEINDADELTNQIDLDIESYVDSLPCEYNNHDPNGIVKDGWDGELDECPDHSAGFDSNTDLAYLFELQEAIDDHEFDKVESAIECDIPLDSIDDAYAGYFEDPKEYAEEFVEQMGDLDNVPDYIQNNLDWEGIADDLMMDTLEHNDHYWNDNY